jgi:HEPN domain-containing protein
LNLSLSYIQISSSINPALILEWFVASIVLVTVVTLVYVFVLSKSPPPEGVTVAKVEEQQQLTQASTSTQIQPAADVNSALTQADASLRANNYGVTVEYSTQAVSESLKTLIQRSSGQVPQNMGMSDLAYLIQSRAKSAPQFAEPTYRLNNLRLRAVQNQAVTPEEANWAVSFAKWLAQVCSSDQIKF